MDLDVRSGFGGEKGLPVFGHCGQATRLPPFRDRREVLRSQIPPILPEAFRAEFVEHESERGVDGKVEVGRSGGLGIGVGQWGGERHEDES